MGSGKPRSRFSGHFYLLRPLQENHISNHYDLIPEVWQMNTLVEKLSLTKQMYLMAGISMTGIATMAAVNLTLTGWDQGKPVILTGIGIAVLQFGLAHYLGRHAAGRATRIVDALRRMADGDLRNPPKLSGKDEFAWMAYECGRAGKAMTRLIREIQGHAGQLAAAAEELSTITDQSRQQVHTQHEETDQVANAMTQMVHTIQEVTRDITRTATAATDADRLAAEGREEYQRTLQSIQTLTDEVEHIAEVIDQVKNGSTAIGGVLEVIQGIAEQTNLLALNAAIEAARAGDQGRGFAVVADEVRTLASRTQSSTSEIQTMIDNLQKASDQAVQAIQTGRTNASTSIERARQANDKLSAILSSVDQISQLNNQVATASQEQSASAEEINTSLTRVRDSFQTTAAGTEQTAGASGELAHLATQLQELIYSFKVAN